MGSRSDSVVLNGVKTNVRTWGKWIKDPIADGEDIVVIIPGNPGVSQFYTEFAEVIHKRTGFAVWVVSYAGHEIIEDIPPLEKNMDKYNLKGQIEHKREFFETYVPRNAKVHVVAHSIGAYQTLKLMRDKSVNDKIANAHLIFPVIEHMGSTEKAKYLTRFVKPLVGMICFYGNIFMAYPRQLKLIILTLYMYVMKLPRKKFLINGCISLLTSTVLTNVYSLAFEEMDNLKDRDDEVIRNNLEKINFIYGELDGWAPRSFYEKLIADIPEVSATVTDFVHAFVLRDSTEVGEYISDEILEKIDCKKIVSISE